MRKEEKLSSGCKNAACTKTKITTRTTSHRSDNESDFAQSSPVRGWMEGERAEWSVVAFVEVGVVLEASEREGWREMKEE